MIEKPSVAYLSMEIALESEIPTYSGGLGILAGDTLRAAADLEFDLVGVSLLYRMGYFRQFFDASGRQIEEPARWRIDKRLEPLAPRVSVSVEGRSVQLRAWAYEIVGVSDGRVSVMLLDADLPENEPEDRRLTDYLYGGDIRYRLAQELLLGVGGVRMLEALGYRCISCFHLNEGHAALAVPELVERRLSPRRDLREIKRALEAVRKSVVFTTHTPVAAGHDRFPAALAKRVLGDRMWRLLGSLDQGPELNMSELAATGAGFVNAVSPRHSRVAARMFSARRVESVSNGVHAPTWVAPPLTSLFDRRLPGWSEDPGRLRDAASLPLRELRAAHSRAKRALIAHVRRSTGARLDADRLTLGFARRATQYKRTTLIFSDLERLRQISRDIGPFQLVFAGKAHSQDRDGKALIQGVHLAAEALGPDVPVVYLPEYDMDSARLLCSGSDVWLNTPCPPLEASGTSGMKAAVNGVPSLSVLDGWWIEGHVEAVTGWSIGSAADGSGRSRIRNDRAHAEALYSKLAEHVLPAFYAEGHEFTRIMRHTIALNGSYFDTRRMLQQYARRAYCMMLGDVRTSRRGKRTRSTIPRQA